MTGTSSSSNNAFLAAVAMLAVVAAGGASAQYLPYDSHLRLAAVSGQNLLFRGPNPVNTTTNTFNYGWLTSLMKQRAAERRVAFPEEFDLVVLSLLTHETADIQAEADFFKANPQLGSFYAWPMWGMNATWMQQEVCPAAGVASDACPSAQPADFNATALAAIGRSAAAPVDPDQLDARLAKVHEMLTTPAKRPVVIYGHCICGCDRTGEFFAVYGMRYQADTFSTIMRYDTGVPTPPRNIGYSHQLYAQWACNRMYYDGSYAPRAYDCTNCQPFRCSDS
jgi:hypothetical protein